MGSSDSKAVTTTNTNILNKQSYYNENIFESTVSKMNEATVHAFQTASKAAGATIHTSQSNTIGNVIATSRGSVVNANINQRINTVLNFTGVQSSQMKNDIVNQAAQAAAQMLETSFSMKSDNTLGAKNNLNTQAQATASILGGSSSSSSDTNTNTNITNDISVQNKTQTKISEYMSNKLSTEIKQEDVQTCMTNLVASQNASAGNLIASGGGIVNFESSQSIDATLTAQCSQLANAMSSAIAELKQASQLDSKNTSDSATTTKATSETTASTSSTATSSLGLGSMPSSASSTSSGASTMIIPIIIALIVICCVSLILKSLMGASSGGGGGGGTTE